MVYKPIDELICRIFLSRNMAHLQHWKTDSYAEHVALGDFYDGVIDKIDGIIELYQGLFSRINHEEDEELEERLEEIDNIVEHLKDDVKFIINSRDDIARKVSSIENLLDDLVDFYGTTLYKLRFLS